jgi:hypothetical protein
MKAFDYDATDYAKPIAIDRFNSSVKEQLTYTCLKLTQRRRRRTYLY